MITLLILNTERQNKVQISKLIISINRKFGKGSIYRASEIPLEEKYFEEFGKVIPKFNRPEHAEVRLKFDQDYCKKNNLIPDGGSKWK